MYVHARYPLIPESATNGFVLPALALTLSERRPPGSLVLLINDEVRASQVIPASDEIDYVWDLPEPL